MMNTRSVFLFRTDKAFLSALDTCQEAKITKPSYWLNINEKLEIESCELCTPEFISVVELEKLKPIVTAVDIHAKQESTPDLIIIQIYELYLSDTTVNVQYWDSIRINVFQENLLRTPKPKKI